MFRKLLRLVKPAVSVLSWEWKAAFLVMSKIVTMLEGCGLKFTAAGILGNFALYGALRGIVAIGGPIPVTPGVILGLELWVAFMAVVLAHTCVDGILVVCGERPL